MVTEDDSWAEAELERQLAALTPIDCIEDAQNKFIDDFRYIEEESAIPQDEEEEEGLPPSVELYITKLQAQVTQLDQELYECENLIQYQTGGSEFIEELEEEEFIEDVLEEGLQEEEWLKHGIHQCDEDGEELEDDNPEENDIAKVFEMTVKYCKQVTPEIEEPLPPITPEKPEEQNEEMFREAREKEQRRAEQLQELERERKRVEQLQQDQMLKLEEEVRLAEAELLKEVQQHEAKLAAMEEQSRLELAQYEAERRRTEERLEKRNNEAAVRIQAHFKGMRTRNQYGEIIKEKIAKKREEILKEQLAKYEQIIEEEKAAVEREIREQERKEERERELKKKHSEKELKRSEQEKKEKAERLAKEIQKKEEEEERLRMETERELHWNKSSHSNLDKPTIIKTVELDNESVTSDVFISPTTSLIRDSQISMIDEDVVMEDLSGMPHDVQDNGEVLDCIHTTFSDCLDYVVDQVDNDKSKEDVNENSMRESSNLNMSREPTEMLNRELTDNEIKRRRKKSAKSSTQETSTDSQPRTEIPQASPHTTLTPVPAEPSTSIEVGHPAPKPQEKPSILSSLANKAKNFFRRTEEANVEQSQAILAELERVDDCTDVVADVPMSSSLEEIPSEETASSLEETTTSSKEVASPKDSSQPVIDTHQNKPSNSREVSFIFPSKDETSSSSSRTSPKPRASKLKKELDVAKSFDSSSRPSSSQRVTSPTAQSLDLEEERKKKRKAASNNARSEYRRRRKVKEISSNPMESPGIFSPITRSPTHFSTFNTPTPPPPPISVKPVIDITCQELLNFRVPSVPATVVKREWDTFNRVVEEEHAAWQAQGKVWDQEPAPPRLGTAHVPSVCNEWRHERGPCIQDKSEFRLTNTDCTSVTVRRCQQFVVNNVYSNSMADNNSLQIEDCKEVTLCLARSTLHALTAVRGDLSTVPKLCEELLILDLSYNSITRIDPAPCRHLTSLNLSNNKLRSTRGLSSLPHLVSLDLSNNCITSLQGIGNLSILRDLNLSHNQLAQCPVLDNHLLLSCLCLAGNGFTDVDSLEVSWLPSLELLDISSNGLTTLPPLYKICPFLSSLNISHNMLDRLTEALQFLLLDILECEGNSDCVKGAEFLGGNERSELCLFGKLCVAQRTSRKYLTNNLSEYSPVECNRAHLTASLKHRTQLVTYNLQQYSAMGLTDDMFDEFTQCEIPSKQETPPPAPVIVPSAGPEHTDHSEQRKSDHAVKLGQKPVVPAVTATRDQSEDHILSLQCLARGYLARQALQRELQRRREEFVSMFRASVVIQAWWKGYWCRKIMWPFCPWLERRVRKKKEQHIAAVHIQSRFRGYMLRKKLSCLMEQTQYELNDIDFAEEVPDFGEFDFDEDALEQGWDLPPTPQLPMNNTPIPNTPHSNLRSVQSKATILSSPVPLLPLRRVSTNGGSEISLLSLPPSRVTSKPPSARSNPSEYSARSTARNSQRAKQQHIQEEWGMSGHTADLLLRRSRRFGDKMTDERKKEIIRKRIAAMRNPLQRTPPPPTASNNSLVDLAEVDEDIHYEWTMNPVPHAKRLVNSQQRAENAGRKAPSQLASGNRRAAAIHVQMYRNPKFSSPNSSEGGSNVKLPPLLRLKKKGT